jgi:hypothetical protein
MSKPTRKMIDILMAGVRKNELDINDMYSLRSLIGNQYSSYLDTSM